MEPTLNMRRLVAVVIAMTLVLSVPGLYIIYLQLPMIGLQELVISWPIALFFGVGIAGSLLCAMALALGGTLPRWFWKKSS